ncbi:MAG TPA: hypothetical protein VGD45_13800 [Steroidobacter sp.]|uniref:hypothetical protein n=1 Tax=Steroidobacter sp. TaxID=1978227 RepID=UPI002ED9E68C
MHEDSSAAQKLVAAVHAILELKYSTWELRQGRTWLLAPQAFLRMEDAGSFGSYAEILNHLQETDPELGRRSNMELQDLVETLREFVSEQRN